MLLCRNEGTIPLHLIHGIFRLLRITEKYTVPILSIPIRFSDWIFFLVPS